jgi:hypothetical protein
MPQGGCKYGQFGRLDSLLDPEMSFQKPGITDTSPLQPWF